MKGIDLFAGGGGTTSGAKQAGIEIVWAANHSINAVRCHELNHPEVEHSCQDLQQADFSFCPDHDILFASPCCQGHSYASGKAKLTKKADKSRSTAWAVVSCLDAKESEVAVIENVVDFRKWRLFDAWIYAIQQLGYSISFNIVNAADLGVPQSRERLFIVCTRSKNPLEIKFDKQSHIPASSFIDLNFEGYEWDLVSNRVKATQNRIINGRKKFGDVFLDAAYGNEKGGRDINKPIGTITTINKHSLVMGDYIRSLTVRELAAAQSFSSEYILPEGRTIAKELIGNAVPPLMAERFTRAVISAL